jgi:hypothetical protein
MYDWTNDLLYDHYRMGAGQNRLILAPSGYLCAILMERTGMSGDLMVEITDDN